MALFYGYPLRDVYKLYNAINADRIRHGALPDPDLAADLHKRVRAEVANHPDPLARPLTKAWRTRSDDGETGTDYRILPEDPEDPWTDEELTEYMLDSEVYYGRGRHDFDCSGDRFTYSWTYTRTPAGIVLLHHWGTDI